MTSVGKTNMINILSGRQFQTSNLSTTSSSYVEKKMNIDNKKYNLQIWDTAGQEKFRSLTKIFIKDSKIVVFVLKRKVFFTENRKGSENLAPFSLIIWNSVITSAF
jgi:small GTP-binding protein